LSEFEFPQNKIANVQSQLENLIEKTYYLHKSAREAYRAYIQGYAQVSANSGRLDNRCRLLIEILNCRRR
jgi:ATP-dependent RNA helicase DDX18/HAS1